MCLKTNFYSFAFLLALSFSLPNAKAQFIYGFKAGVNYSTFGLLQYSNPAAYRYSHMPSYHAGFAIDHYFDDWLLTRGELLFNDKGSIYASTTEGASSSEAVHIRYISMPLLMKIKALPRTYLTAGGEVSVAVQKLEAPFKKSNGFWDIGLLGGLAFDVTSTIGIEARYVHGLMSAMRAPLMGANQVLITQQYAFNRCFQLSLSYMLVPKSGR